MYIHLLTLSGPNQPGKPDFTLSFRLLKACQDSGQLDTLTSTHVVCLNLDFAGGPRDGEIV